MMWCALVNKCVVDILSFSFATNMVSCRYLINTYYIILFIGLGVFKGINHNVRWSPIVGW